VAEESDLKQELETARATIAAQAIQIHRLEQQAERDSGAGALREILELSDIAGVTIGEAPYHALLEGIIQAAKRLFDASAASIALLDHETNELVFEAATEGDVVGMRFPAHQGIAGWVAMTGEPLAVSDVRRDPRWAKDFAASTGYIPKSILAVPLFVQEEVEGVLPPPSDLMTWIFSRSLHVPPPLPWNRLAWSPALEPCWFRSWFGWQMSRARMTWYRRPRPRWRRVARPKTRRSSWPAWSIV
jgi:hypothetical protein